MNIVLVGISGYGSQYLKVLLKGNSAYSYMLAGVVDPFPENCPFLKELEKMRIQIYPTLEAFYAASEADLAIISSPIQFHSLQTCLALSHGSHVLCEKPISSTVDDALKMIEAQKKANKLVAIGYQWSYSKAIQALKRDISSGLFGKPKRLKTIVLWPRTDRYYARGWAGKRRDSSGNMILDSVANNATAHYIHNMFYVLGKNPDQSARAANVVAELYRANPIENFDTAAAKVYTDEGVELLYYGSHAVDEKVGAKFSYEFENAEISYDENGKEGTIVARFHNGEKIEYDNPNHFFEDKLWMVMHAARTNDRVLCGLDAALSHTLCIEGMHESMSEIMEFPEAMVRRGEPFWNNEVGNYVEGLVKQLEFCYEHSMLPHEAGFSWAKAGKEVCLK